MHKTYTPSKGILRYHERTEDQEFGRPRKDYRQCEICHCLYFGKSWHHQNHINRSLLLKTGHKIWLTRCPACKMIAARQFEGVVKIYDIPRKYRNELFHMIKGFGLREFSRDCQHRVIEIRKDEKGVWTVTTTENQLAGRLARKIKEVFDKVSVRHLFSEAPDDLERIRVEFLPYLSFT